MSQRVRTLCFVADDAERIDELLASFHEPVDAARWAEQFEPDEQEHVLRVVRRWIEAYYWDPARVEDVLDALINDLGDERVAIAPLQPAGSVQACLNKLLVKRLRAHGLVMPTRVAAADVHVYLDGVACTGRTLDKHLRRYLPRVAPGSSVLVFHLVEHAHDVKERRAALHTLADELGVVLRTDHALRVENRHEALGGLETVMPTPWSARAIDAEYKRVGRAAFREVDLWGDGPLWDDPEERDVVECALLRIGSGIAKRAPRVRPLGVGEGTSLGFGCVSWTFHDAQPTMPLALWWQDDTWFPLVASRR
jgi:hypothetical protein